MRLFSSLSKKELDRLSSGPTRSRSARATSSRREGEFAHEFFVIEEGTADVLKDGERIAELGPGDFFGEIGLIETERRTATVVATKTDGADRHVPARVQTDGAGDARSSPTAFAPPFAPDSTRASSTCPHLFDPASHEPLTARPWDERRAREAIAAIVAEAEDAFDEHALWPAHPLDEADGPLPAVTSLYLGASGVVWAFHELEHAGARRPSS